MQVKKTAGWELFSNCTFGETIRQYKTFQFKMRDEEIGGDLCILHKISLCGREHAVFLNADAMGKSIQGADGATHLYMSSAVISSKL